MDLPVETIGSILNGTVSLEVVIKQQLAELKSTSADNNHLLKSASFVEMLQELTGNSDNKCDTHG